jgi:hypothetical protein
MDTEKTEEAIKEETIKEDKPKIPQVAALAACYSPAVLSACPGPSRSPSMSTRASCDS